MAGQPAIRRRRPGIQVTAAQTEADTTLASRDHKGVMRRESTNRVQFQSRDREGAVPRICAQLLAKNPRYPLDSKRTDPRFARYWGRIHRRDARPLPYGRGSDQSMRAFSMAELMVAVVILGIGLLITTSMFPIAWLKARDVAESTNVATAALTADIYAKSLLRVNGPGLLPDQSVTSFFPGDWFSGHDPSKPYIANVYPDTRVHLLNTGNYGVGFATEERDPLDSTGGSMAPVGDNGWLLDDVLVSALDFAVIPDFQASRPYVPVIAPHVRMIPPMEVRPNPMDVNTTPEQLSLWNEQFETRRHCWGIFYRFSKLTGPDPLIRGRFVSDVTIEPSLIDVVAPSLLRPRRLTMYYVTLKRQGSARYARQLGFEIASNSWNVGNRLDNPRSRPPQDDVLLPTPWRFEAEITPATLPPNGNEPQSGIPTEIQVDDIVIANMVQEGSYLIDDRNGEVFVVASIKETSGSGQVIFVLNKEYRAGDLYDIPNYEPFPVSDVENYDNATDFEYNKSTGAPPCCPEDTPEQRFYWVFPPPVDATDTVRAGGVPLFDGPQPVVGIEVRQLTIAPRLGS